MSLKAKPARQEALDAVRTLIAYIGDDPDRPGLKDTPNRVVKAWEKDWGQGYQEHFQGEQATSITGGLFADENLRYNQMVVVKNINFVSHCEHHMAAFHGTVSIAYIPNEGKVLGLSKFARVTDLVTRKLQVQERITLEIADMVQEATTSEHVGVIVTAVHMCMCSRGVRQPESETTTSEVRGDLLKDPSTRAEFLRLVQ